MAGDAILLTLDGPRAQITLNRPEVGNRLATPDLLALAEALDAVAAHRPTVLVLRATGPDFCLGRDASGDADPSAAQRSLRTVVEIARRVRDLPTVVVASVRGRSRGLGSGLVFASDIAIAADGADFAFDEVERGFPPTIVMTYLEDSLPAKVARDLLFTGRPMDTREAVARGAISRLTAEADLDAETDRLVDQLAALDQAAVFACKPYLASLPQLPSERDERAIADGAAFFASMHGAPSSNPKGTDDADLG